MASEGNLVVSCTVVDDDDDCNSLRIKAATTSLVLVQQHQPIQKMKHHHHQRPPRDVDDDEYYDDTTTAYSSWVEDNCSQLSSCRSSHDEDDDRNDDEDVDDHSHLLHYSHFMSSPASHLCVDDDDLLENGSQDGNNGMLLRYTSFSSSYYSAVSTQQLMDEESMMFTNNKLHPQEIVVVSSSKGCSSSKKHDYLLPEGNDSDRLSELSERAQHMIKREQLANFPSNDYFHQADDGIDELSSRGSNQQDNVSYSPIDSSCRSKMMDWSLRVVAFSFPNIESSEPHEDLEEEYSSPRMQRKYSIQALQIVSQAFVLVDRLASLHLEQNNDCPMNRSEYKMTCMVCLHLVAKTCGLFGLYDRDLNGQDAESTDEEKETSPIDNPKQRQESTCIDSESDSCCYYIRQSSTSSLSLSSMAVSQGTTSSNENMSSSQIMGGQTILSTPGHSTFVNNDSAHTGEHPRYISIERDDSNNCHQQDAPTRNKPKACKKRPPLSLLSLIGLSTLCQNEFTMEALVQMELKVLKTLDWKLNSVSSCVDWCHVLLDLLTACTTATNNGHVAGRSSMYLETIREHTLTNVETAMEMNLILAPSLVAWTAVVQALKDVIDHDDNDGNQLLCNIIVPEYKKMVLGILPYRED